MSLLVMSHRDHEMAPILIAIEDDAGQIGFVQTLHHNNDGALLRIVEPRRMNFPPPACDLEAICIGLDLLLGFGVVGVI
jgi:hypothetical protein